jgi:hypothetical protein
METMSAFDRRGAAIRKIANASGGVCDVPDVLASERVANRDE